MPLALRANKQTGCPLLQVEERSCLKGGRVTGQGKKREPDGPFRASLASRTEIALRRVVRPALQAGCVLSLGDLIAQAVEISTEGASDASASSRLLVPDSYDVHRTGRFALVGLTCHGPWFYFAFGLLDRLMGPGSTLATVLGKVVVTQIAIFPPYLAALFAYLGVLEGSVHSLDDAVRVISTKWPGAYAAGCVFWPIANIVNFSVVPSPGRVLYVASTGVLWNTYLSWYNQRARRKEREGERGNG